MTVKELIDKLQTLPADAEVCVDRGGAYDDAKSVEYADIVTTGTRSIVFISSEEDRG